MKELPKALYDEESHSKTIFNDNERFCLLINLFSVTFCFLPPAFFYILLYY